MTKWPPRLATVGLCTGVALVASLLGSRFPVIGAPIFSIALGILIANTTAAAPWLKALQIGEVSRFLLKAGIVLIGASLNLFDVLQAGKTSLAVLVFTLAAGFLFAQLAGRHLGVSWRMRCLVGVGTIICGASAIVAIAPVIRARMEEIAYAISTIFFFNMLAVIVFRAIGHLFHFSDAGFGLWTGTAVNDTSAVVAAGYAYSQSAGNYATIVKLTRTTLIIPITFAFSLWISHRDRRAAASAAEGKPPLSRSIPWFIGLFVIASLLETVGAFGAWAPQLQTAGRFVLLVALAAVGLQGHYRTFAGAGLRPLMLGMGTWAVVALVSLGVQLWTGQL